MCCKPGMIWPDICLAVGCDNDTGVQPVLVQGSTNSQPDCRSWAQASSPCFSAHSSSSHWMLPHKIREPRRHSVMLLRPHCSSVLRPKSTCKVLSAMVDGAGSSVLSWMASRFLA